MAENGVPSSAAAAEDERPIEIVAAAVRSRGHACDHPEKAERDTGNSEPGQAVWILTCETAVYRVTFIGDAGPLVERID